MRIVTTVLLLLVSSHVLAGSSLPAEMARNKGFIGCDNAISKAFESTTFDKAGEDLRVNALWFADTKSELIQLTATSGTPGDSVYSEATFQKHDSKCYWMKSTIISSSQSCMAYKESVPAFKVTAQSADFTWAANPGGVLLILKPTGTSCLAIFQTSGILDTNLVILDVPTAPKPEDTRITQCAEVAGEWAGTRIAAGRLDAIDLTNPVHRAAVKAEGILPGSGLVLILMRCVRGQSLDGDLGATAILRQCKARGQNAQRCFKQISDEQRRLYQ